MSANNNIQNNVSAVESALSNFNYLDKLLGIKGTTSSIKKNVKVKSMLEVIEKFQEIVRPVATDLPQLNELIDKAKKIQTRELASKKKSLLVREFRIVGHQEQVQKTRNSLNNFILAMEKAVGVLKGEAEPKASEIDGVLNGLNYLDDHLGKKGTTSAIKKRGFKKEKSSILEVIEKYQNTLSPKFPEPSPVTTADLPKLKELLVKAKSIQAKEVASGKSLLVKEFRTKGHQRQVERTRESLKNFIRSNESLVRELEAEYLTQNQPFEPVRITYLKRIEDAFSGITEQDYNKLSEQQKKLFNCSTPLDYRYYQYLHSPPFIDMVKGLDEQLKNLSPQEKIAKIESLQAGMDMDSWVSTLMIIILLSNEIKPELINFLPTTTAPVIKLAFATLYTYVHPAFSLDDQEELNTITKNYQSDNFSPDVFEKDSKFIKKLAIDSRYTPLLESLKNELLNVIDKISKISNETLNLSTKREMNNWKEDVEDLMAVIDAKIQLIFLQEQRKLIPEVVKNDEYRVVSLARWFWSSL